LEQSEDMTSQRRIIFEGEALTLYAVESKEGVCEVDDWLDALEDRAFAAFEARFTHLCAIGHLRATEQWRYLDDDVFEIKVHTGPGYRLYMLRDGNDFTATHGRKKPDDRKVKRETKKAAKIFGKHKRGEL
jgi:putative component of toxin-antitoxin plasmid stabilization module